MLSQGGGGTFSVRSGFLSNITVETPKSFFSKRSGALSTRGGSLQPFSKYRPKQQGLKTPSDIFAARAPDSERSALTYVDHASDLGSTVSNPLLQKYIDRGMGKRTVRKTKFEYTNSRDLKEIVTKQMNERDETELHAKVDRIMDERKMLRDNRNLMVKD